MAKYRFQTLSPIESRRIEEKRARERSSYNGTVLSSKPASAASERNYRLTLLYDAISGALQVREME
jgi:hypothetical protein